MNYDGDDELERMRQRRQMRREGRQDPDRFGYEDSRYGEGFYERGSRTRREAETSRSGRQSAGRAGERPERRMREGERDRARQDGGRTSQNRQSRTRDREREASGCPVLPFRLQRP